MTHLPPALRTLVIALALVACSRTPDPAERPAPSASDRLTLTRGPCFGACPMYTVTAWGDGRVEFEGRQFVEKTGTHTATVDAASVAALFAQADSIGFFDLPADITPANQAACGSAWTDMPGVETTVVWSERDHTVNHYHGCPKAPAELTAFEERVDAVLGTARWIGRR